MKPNKNFAIASIVFTILYLIASIGCIIFQKQIIGLAGIDTTVLMLPWWSIIWIAAGSICTLVLAVISMQARKDIADENAFPVLVISIIYAVAAPLLFFGLNYWGTMQMSLKGVEMLAAYQVLKVWLDRSVYLLLLAGAFLLIQVGINYGSKDTPVSFYN